MANEKTNEFVSVANNVAKLLAKNPEWVDRYAKYAKLLLKKEKTVKDKKKLFHEFKPLFLYMNVANATGSGIFGLRYAGQQVADLFVRENEVLIDTESYDKSNKRDFDCDVQLKGKKWNSPEATKFRNHFLTKLPIRNEDSKKGNEEHRIESMLLGEFSKKQSKNKLILGIQPVRLFGDIARFQMPTPLAASSGIKYSERGKGGIDIMCRIGSGTKTKLCVIEVKDENTNTEPPQETIKQAIAYAVFLRELLRSKSGNDWYKVFGFSRNVPDKLEIVASIAMPVNEKIISNFEKTEIQLGNKDKLILHSIYFVEEDRKLVKLMGSLKALCK